MRHGAALLAAMACLALAWPGAVRADAALPCPEPIAADCVLEHAAGRLADGEPLAALDALKAHRETAGGERRFALLLARAYLDTGNRVWALRTLGQRLRDAPDDCDARAGMAWLLVQDARLDEARDALDRSGCPMAPADETRWALLRAFVDREQERTDDAQATMAALGRPEALYPEDRALYDHLFRSLWPNAEPPLSATAELKVGWTADPRLDSPNDAPTTGDDASGLVGGFRASVRLGWSFTPWFHPFLEPELEGVAFSSTIGGDLSYLRPGGRAGISWGLPGARLRSSYRYEALLLRGGDAHGEGPVWYSEGHRGELELDVGASQHYFVRGGRREFRPRARIRWELELGTGLGFRLGERVLLLGGLSGRMHRAQHPGYHRWGGTLLIALDVMLGAGWSARGNVSVGVDVYPDWERIASSTGGAQRRDILVRGAVGVWSPPMARVRVGLTYEPSRRFSTDSSYDFEDHRVLFHARFTFRGDPFLPAGSAPEDHVALPYGFGTGEGAVGERIQELLRQDEESQRGSSCMD